MRTYLPIAAMFIFLISFAESDTWVAFEKTWDTYIAQQTHENAVRVYEQLPNEVLNRDLPRASLVDKLYEGWGHINQKITEGNKDVVQIGFKLYPLVDGAFKEDIGADLGKLITVNPTLFLQELKIHRKLIQNLDGIVCNYGEKYIDRKDLQIEETDRRMKMLVNVSDPELAEVKAECLQLLMKKSN